MGVLLLSVRWTRENGTIDQGTHATKNDAGTETANVELTDQCHPRTRNLKNEHDFSVALSGSEWLDSGFEWLGVARQWLKWLGVARQWLGVDRQWP